MAHAGRDKVHPPQQIFQVFIDAAGGVNIPTLPINNGDIVEFIATTVQSWEIAYSKGSGVYHALTVFVPALGSAFIVGDSKDGDETCEYTIRRARGCVPPEKPKQIKGNNQIIIGQREGKSKRGA